MSLFIQAGERAHAAACRQARTAAAYRRVEAKLRSGGAGALADLFGGVAGVHEAVALTCTRMGQQRRLNAREAGRLDALLVLA